MRASPFYLCAYCCCSVIWLIIIILIASSFEYVRYDEMAFARNSVTNKVDTSQVYPTGRHMVGPTISMVVFPRQYQTEDFTGGSALSVFNEEGLDTSIEVTFQYRIREENVINLMETYGTNYEGKLRSVAEATLKNSAFHFTVFHFRNNRTMLVDVFNRNVTRALNELFIELEDHKLQIGRIILPTKMQIKFMDDAVQRQKNDQADFVKSATKVRVDTEKEVARITSNATFVQRAAGANATRIVDEAQAESDRILADAYGNGWVDAMIGLGITNSTDKAEFLRLMGILDNPSQPQLIDKDLDVIIQGGR